MDILGHNSALTEIDFHILTFEKEINNLYSFPRNKIKITIREIEINEHE